MCCRDIQNISPEIKIEGGFLGLCKTNASKITQSFYLFPDTKALVNPKSLIDKVKGQVYARKYYRIFFCEWICFLVELSFDNLEKSSKMKESIYEEKDKLMLNNWHSYIEMPQ